MSDTFSERAHFRDKKELKDPVAPGLAWLVADFPWLSVAIAGVNTGSAGSASLVVAGDVTGQLPAGAPIWVRGSTGNDGGYRISASAYSSGDDQTTLDVNEEIDGVDADGSIYWPLPENLAVAVATPAAGPSGPSFGVSGDFQGVFLPNWQIQLARSANNSGVYTIASAPLYDSNTNVTTIPVVESIASSTADGYLRGRYPSPSDNPGPLAFPAAIAAAIDRNGLDGSPQVETPAVPGTSPARIYSPGEYIPRGSLVRALRDGRGFFPVSRTNPAFLFAGGLLTNYGPLATSGTHCRLDPESGVVLWVANRGSGPTGLCADPLGYNYTCGLASSGNTHEKWDRSGNNVWSSAAITTGPGSGGSGTPKVNAIAVDPSGYVYTGSLEAELMMLRKWDPLGNQVTTGNFPITVSATTSASTAINGIAIDPVDGRIALATGSLTSLPGGGAFHSYVYDNTGAPLTLSGTASATSQALAAVAFDWLGNLYSVGVGAPPSPSYVGYIFDHTNTFNTSIFWHNSSVQNAAYSLAADSVGRVLVGSSIQQQFVDASAWYPVNPFTAGLLLPGLSTSAMQFAGKVATEHQSRSVAVDRAGNQFIAGMSLNNSQASIYAFDPTGKLLWINPLFYAVNSSTISDYSAFLLVAAG